MDRTQLAQPQRARFCPYKHLHTLDSLSCRPRSRQLWTTRLSNCEKFLLLPRNNLRRMWLSPFAYQDDEAVTPAAQPRALRDHQGKFSQVCHKFFVLVLENAGYCRAFL